MKPRRVTMTLAAAAVASLMNADALAQSRQQLKLAPSGVGKNVPNDIGNLIESQQLQNSKATSKGLDDKLKQMKQTNDEKQKMRQEQQQLKQKRQGLEDKIRSRR